MLRSLVVAVVSFAWLGVSQAQDAPKGTAYAVIVGLGEFADPLIKPREKAVADAQAIFDAFVDPKVGGVPVANATLLLSSEDAKRGAKKGTKENILAAIKSVAEKAGKDDRVFFVMIGQGAPSGDRACFFAVDSTFKDRVKNAVAAADLDTALKGIKANDVCALLDLNLKGFDAGTETVVEPNGMDFVRPYLGMKEKDEGEPPMGRVVILAGSGVNPPVNDGTHGIFTTAILSALQGGADTDGYEPDGIVTVDELTKYIENEVPVLARKFGKNNEEKQQLPFYLARASHFPVSKNPTQTGTVEKRLASLAAMNTLPKDVQEEGKKLLSRMPKVKALQELRKDYQKLADGGIKENEFITLRTKVLDGMKLDSDSARTFAVKLMRGMETYKEDYIKELNLGEMSAQAIKGIYLRLDETLPDAIKTKLDAAKDLPKSDLVVLLAEARMPLGKREDLEKDHDVEIGLKSAIVKFVDPYTDYIDAERVAEMEKDVQGFFNGIGVQIRRDIVRDGLLVVTPIRNSPAYKMGLRAGDLITEIRRDVDNFGKPLDKQDVQTTKGMKVTDAVKLIVGKPGTKVKVMVEREGVPAKEYEITRGLVEVESVLGYKRLPNDDWDFYIDPENKIAYIHLTQFARKSFIDMEKVVKKLDREKVRGVILDVRNNPGGYLDVARDICDMFIDDGLIVTIRPRVRQVTEMRGHQEGSYLDFPMVVLVNGNSASGSEILAGCLQDHSRAIIMGERSYGKGSVQNIQKFSATGGEIKLTTATFWRPNNKNLNKASTKGTDEEDWGVRPDKGFEFKLSRADSDLLFDRLRDWGNIPNREAKPKEPTKAEKEFKDRQLDEALNYLKSQIKLSGNIPMKKAS